MRHIITAVIFLATSLVCFGDTWTVKQDGTGDFTTIQDAIDYSWDGDTVVVYPGIWTEDVFFNSRAITLTSLDPDDPCVVDSTIINATVTFDFGEDENSVVQGFSFTGAQPTEFAIGTATSSQNYPAIYGNIVVWQDSRNGNYDIYGKNLSTGQEFAICTAANTQSSPAIYGDVVVWHDSRNGNNDIYAKNLSTGQEFAVCTAENNQEVPVIYDDIVVWQDVRNGNYDIFGKNLSTGVEFAVCTDANTQQQPAICGGMVVWEDNRNGNWDIYGSYSIIPVLGPRIVNNAVVCYYSNPTITSNNFYGFSKAVCGYVNSAPSISSNIFRANFTAISDAKGVVEYNLFENNLSALKNCSGIISNNIISKNITGFSGGSGQITGNDVIANGTAFSSVGGEVKDNLVAGNSHGFVSCDGSIINNSIVDSKEVAINNCTGVIKNNIIAFNKVGISGSSNNSYNCFWKNTESNFQNGAYGKTGDFFADPKFAVNGVWADNIWTQGDYHLKSQAGRWDDANGVWVNDSITSACIDRGDPNDSIGYEQQPNGGRINVGAFGGTIYASKSTGIAGPEPSPYCTEKIEGDLNNDCKVDFADFAKMVSKWLECNLVPQDACW